MMKRTAAPRLGPDDPNTLPQSMAQIQQAGASNMHTLAQSAQPQILGATAMLSVGGGGGFRSAPRAPNPAPPPAPAVINYLKPMQYKQPQTIKPMQQPLNAPPPLHGRQSPAPAPPPPGAAQFQRLKVEDALSYLDQVKYKFNTQPQVYNDFLDIMKEFKSQTIDTPGVITRVSNLFKGHPELIVGFNTFLPPGYKIEVQSNGQVSVSMPSPTGQLGGGGGVLLGVHHAPPQPQLVHLLPVAPSVSSAIVHNLSVSAAPANTLHHISQAHQQIEAAAIHHQQQQQQPGGGGGGPPPHPPAPPGQPVEFNHAIEYVNKIKSRFSRQPDKYKRFLEILHAYQRGHRDVKEPQAKQQTEQEVYSQVAKLFENQEDLLAEFGQFLPDAKAITKPPHYVNPRDLLPPPQRAEPERERLDTPPPHPPPQHPPPQHHQTIQIPKHPSVLPSAPPPPQPHHHLKRSPSFTSTTPMSIGAPPPKKSRQSLMTGATVRDVSYAEAAKLATVHDYSFFDKAKRALRSQHVYDNFLRDVSYAEAAKLATVHDYSFFDKAKRALRSQHVYDNFLRDVSYAEAAKLATVHDYSFFDKAKRALRSQHVYDNFLRCLLLFTNEIISSSELLVVTAPFLCRHPELQKWLQDFVAPPSPPHTPTNTDQHMSYNNFANTSSNSLLNYSRDRNERVRYEPVGAYGAQLRHDRPMGDANMDIDLTTCKRLGTSYCALPREAAARRCSGRTALCKEVLNDTWVSFPTWSEDSTFVTSRKTQYEEYIYRCEDERFELDVVIETNAATIRVLEGVQKKLSRMTPEDAAKYRLDDCLGGHSPTIHQRALKRIYGDKVAVDIIAGLKKNPVVAVPVVLRRLKAKEEEWREAQKGFNKQWREQNEKYYLKSLDHQGINFKQNDLKALRSKTLFNEVESVYAARKPGPHLVVDYNMTSRQEAIKIVRDCTDLLIHHARRQTAIQKTEKRKIKQLLRQFIPDLLNHPRQPASDDEHEEKDEPSNPCSPAADENKDSKETDKPAADKVKQEKESSESDAASDKSGKNNNGKNDKENKPKNNNQHLPDKTDKDTTPASNNTLKRSSSDEMKTEVKSEEVEDDLRDHPSNEARFVCTSSWYLFFRLHGVVCSRLAAARRTAQQLHEQEQKDAARQHPSVATALKLKPNNLPSDASSPAEYYNALLELVKGVLDGNVEPSAFEDAAREMLGIKAYPAFTLDKLVSIAVRQLQHVVTEPWACRAVELCRNGGMRGPLSYVRRAASQLKHDHSTFLIKFYGGDECKVAYELLENNEGRTSPHNDNSRLSPPTNQSRPSTTNGEAVSRLAEWSLYTERYARPDLSAHPPPRNKPVFLRRNARKCGGYSHNVAAGQAQGDVTVPHARRKRLTVQDSSECTLNNTLRLLASRPHYLYRAGSLGSAKAQQPRLSAARRARFRAWLRTHENP
ncbi:paired amphipathic helix repeat domain-containing protein [Phthorimaea operculella]|nr:paired amphipathic helix repeat domain-containing protein [Phthorimaea operculella]